MSNASNIQVSFLGGELAPSFQGRADHPKYKTGLALSRNGLPLEQGSWVRRPGTRVAATTRGGAFAKIIDFDFEEAQPFTAEFTAYHLRFFQNYQLIDTYDTQNVSSVSTANPAVVTQTGNAIWSNGDVVEFTYDSSSWPDAAPLLLGRQFLIAGVSGYTFDLYDPITGGTIDGSVLAVPAGLQLQVNRILDIATPYSLGMLPNLRGIQALNGTVNTLVILNGSVAPQALTATSPPQPAFALNPASFMDGPYLDPPNNGVTLTPSGLSGSITLTASAPTFASTDVNRHIRLFSQPSIWSDATAYTTNELVTYADAYYVALQDTTGNVPGSDAVNWGVASNVTAWVWGIITTYTDSTHVTVDLQVVNTSTLQLPGVLVNNLAITSDNWQLGLYNGVTGWPTCGTYQEGRLWLSGSVSNRIDGGVVNDLFNFSPSLIDGTVTDANAISYTFNSKDLNPIFWMTTADNGIICGTQAGEWVVQSSTNADPLTPTNIQAHRKTRYGCANIEPVEAPFATLFVERNNRKLFEYLADVFTGKMAGINLSLTGAHLSGSGIAEIKYQKELAPILWARMNDGSLAGMTYRRDSPMLSTDAAFSGWHRHDLGNGRSVQSISVGPSMNGDLDALTLVTLDPVTGIYWIELMTDLFDQDNGTNEDAWFLDGGVVPSGALLAPDGSTLTLYGLNMIDGLTVSVYIAGIDAGDFAVSNSEIVIPLPAGYNNSGLLTVSEINSSNDPSLLGTAIAMPVTVSGITYPTGSQFLQAYIDTASSVVGSDQDTFLVDAIRGRVYDIVGGTSSTTGIRAFDMWSGALLNEATNPEIFGTRNWNISAPICLTYDNAIIMPSTGSNSNIIARVDAETFIATDFCGTVSSNLIPDKDNIQEPNVLAPVRIGGHNFVVYPTVVTTTIGVLCVDHGNMQFAGHSFDITGRGHSVSAGDGTGIVYTCSTDASAYYDIVYVYKTVIMAKAAEYDPATWPTFPNVFITTTLVGTITPTQVDATWSTFDGFAGPIYDGSDGNIMMFLSTNNTVTNQSYLVKVNAVNADVMWACPTVSIPTAPAFADNNFCFGGVYACLLFGAPSSFNVFNTVAGTVSTTFLSDFVAGGQTVWDARTGLTFAFCSALEGNTMTPLNQTPAFYSNAWTAFSVQPGIIPTQARKPLMLPACVGTTFTSQGQRLRGLEPQDTGARNGPALGKTRRNHRLSSLLLNSTAVYFGTTFVNIRKAIFKSLGGNAYVDNQLFSGVYSNTVEDTYSYDGMLCWQTNRPYPLNVLAVEGFLETADR